MEEVAFECNRIGPLTNHANHHFSLQAYILADLHAASNQLHGSSLPCHIRGHHSFCHRFPLVFHSYFIYLFYIIYLIYSFALPSVQPPRRPKCGAFCTHGNRPKSSMQEVKRASHTSCHETRPPPSLPAISPPPYPCRLRSSSLAAKGIIIIIRRLLLLPYRCMHACVPLRRLCLLPSQGGR